MKKHYPVIAGIFYALLTKAAGFHKDWLDFVVFAAEGLIAAWLVMFAIRSFVKVASAPTSQSASE